MDKKTTTKEDQMMVVRYFKHLKLTSASTSEKLGFTIDMRGFLDTVRVGKTQTIRKKTVSTQTDETRSISPSIFSKEFKYNRTH